MYPLKRLVNLVELLCFIGQLSSDVAADEDALEIHPFTLNQHPDLRSTARLASVINILGENNTGWPKKRPCVVQQGS